MLPDKFDGLHDCDALLLAISPRLIIRAHYDPGADEILERNRSL
jgi:hypothetical protein